MRCVILCHLCQDTLLHFVNCPNASLTFIQLHTNTNALLNSNVWKSPTVINPKSLRQIACVFVDSHKRTNKQTQAIGSCFCSLPMHICKDLKERVHILQCFKNACNVMHCKMGDDVDFLWIL